MSDESISDLSSPPAGLLTPECSQPWASPPTPLDLCPPDSDLKQDVLARSYNASKASAMETSSLMPMDCVSEGDELPSKSRIIQNATSRTHQLLVALVLGSGNLSTLDIPNHSELDQEKSAPLLKSSRTQQRNKRKRNISDMDSIATEELNNRLATDVNVPPFVGVSHTSFETESRVRKKPFTETDDVDGHILVANPTRTKTKARVPKSLVPKYDTGNVTLHLPEPSGQPLVWATKRQALCDTLPYYRSHQGAAYHADGIVQGFLIDKEVKGLDRFTEHVVICGVGGGQDQNAAGQRVQMYDQVTSNKASYLQLTMDKGLPVALIAGYGNSISPCALPHRYNVLDWFHITDVWCEKAPLRRWVVRFERINFRSKSWWTPKSDAEPNTEESPKSSIQTCSTCSKDSKVIYAQGWTCLSTICNSYFQFEQDVDPSKLTYSNDFLLERTTYKGPPPQALKPENITQESQNRSNTFGFEKMYKRGIVCPRCNCCVRRLDWRKWVCENPDCDETYQLQQKPMPITEAISDNVKADNEDLEDCKTIASSVRTCQHTFGLYRVYDYILPGENGEDVGFVRLLKSSGVINQQKDGPNDLFQDMQVNEFYMKKRPARNPGTAIEVVTSHWTSNWGAPYKFAVAQDSRAFTDAPDVIIKALKRMTWAGEQALTSNGFETFHPFNELLALGYFEDSDIGYHDDGESTLGPTVATLSLGCSAYMSFRPKNRTTLGGGRIENSKTRHKSDVLKVLLEHGDIVLMHGRDIHKLYEHSVKPHGKLRFALTCRYIVPETLANDEEREDARIKSMIPPHLTDYTYDGDINSIPLCIEQLQGARYEAENAVNNFVIAKEHVGELAKAVAKEILVKALDRL